MEVVRDKIISLQPLIMMKFHLGFKKSLSYFNVSHGAFFNKRYFLATPSNGEIEYHKIHTAFIWYVYRMCFLFFSYYTPLRLSI